MRCSKCGKCCEETEMLLSEDDIANLEKMGYPRESFVRTDKDGFSRLRNWMGLCVFYQKESRRCKVYRQRPMGCRVYPVVYDEDKGLVADDICPMKDTVSQKELKLKGRTVVRLLRKIDREAEATCLLHKTDEQS